MSHARKASQLANEAGYTTVAMDLSLVTTPSPSGCALGIGVVVTFTGEYCPAGGLGGTPTLLHQSLIIEVEDNNPEDIVLNRWLLIHSTQMGTMMIVLRGA